jgi:hypothetical protein
MASAAGFRPQRRNPGNEQLQQAAVGMVGVFGDDQPAAFGGGLALAVAAADLAGFEVEQARQCGRGPAGAASLP